MEDGNTRFARVRARPRAGEEELAFGLTDHGGKIAGGELWGRLGVCLPFCKMDRAGGERMDFCVHLATSDFFRLHRSPPGSDST